ncbi:MAG: hypothetical protein PHN72_00890 [Bacilli bacterium]|nr:hypothetical protein [Bacilli bacterium]
MKKYVIILFLFLFSVVVFKQKVDTTFIEKIDLGLKKNEIGIIFIPTKDNEYLLLKKDQHSILLPLEEKNGNKGDILEKINQDQIEYSYSSEIKGKIKASLEIPLEVDNIYIEKKEDNIIIKLEDQNFCIYKEGSLETCNYVYFRKDIHLPENNIKLAFYKEGSHEILEKELYDKWIDSYPIKIEELTIMKFHDSTYNVIRIPGYYF